jgi:hypothetical protein
VVELKVVGLQQREEEGGEWEYEPKQKVISEKDELIVPQAIERVESAQYPPIEL